MHKAANDNAGRGGDPAPRTVRFCPICGKPAAPDVTPFCSKRCADVDLHRWLGEGYRLPASENDAGSIGEEET